MAFPYRAASKGESEWDCAPLVGYDSKPVTVQVEVKGYATAGAWANSWELGRHRVHPDTGATLLLLFPGEEWRLRLRNMDGSREVLAALYVDGRNAASGASVRLPSGGGDIVWAGWRDAAGAEVAPFVAAEMPTIDRRLNASEAAAAAEVGGLRIDCAYETALEVPRAHVFATGGAGSGDGPVRGTEAIALSSTKKIDQGLGTAPPPILATVTRNITSIMGPVHARGEERASCAAARAPRSLSPS